MGQMTIGSEALVTSWAGTNNTQLLSVLGKAAVTFDMQGNPPDRTQFAGSIVNTSYGPGLASWTGTISARFLTSSLAYTGYAGSLAIGGTDMTTTWIKSYKLSLRSQAFDTTSFGSTATTAGWMSFRPGLITASGSYELMLDSAAGIKPPFLPAASSFSSLPTATFSLTSVNTLAMSIVPQGVGVNLNVGALNAGTVSFMGSGAITAATSGDTNMFDAGTLTLPDWDASGTDGVCDTTLICQASASRTYTGAAFWTSIDISVDPKAYTDVQIGFQGSGALVPA